MALPWTKGDKSDILRVSANGMASLSAGWTRSLDRGGRRRVGLSIDQQVLLVELEILNIDEDLRISGIVGVQDYKSFRKSESMIHR